MPKPPPPLLTAGSKPQIHGLAFDGAVFLGTLFFSWILLSPVFQAAKPRGSGMNLGFSFAILLAVAAFAQIPGALLKWGPLAARMGIDEPGRWRFRNLARLPAALLLPAHLILFFVMMVLVINIPEAKSWSTPGALPRIVGILFLAGMTLPTLATAWALVAPAPAPCSWFRHPAGEWIGNGLLIFSMAVLQAFFQENLLSGISVTSPLAPDFDVRSGYDWGRMAGPLLLLFPLFILFYLPPRILFLVEDWNRGRTWVRILGLNFLLWIFQVFLPKG